MELAYVRMVLDSCFYERIMNMKKLLATGLIASVAMSSAESSASCGNGGFYVGANVGVAFTKAKATKNENVVYTDNDLYGGADSGVTIGGEGNGFKKISKGHAEARSKTAAASMDKMSKKKTKSLAELVLGYDFRLGDVMIGVELNAGSVFGTSRFKSKDITVAQANLNNNGILATAHDFTQDAKEYARIRELWHIALTPRIGYLFTPQFEGYVTFGVKLANFNTTVDNLMIRAVIAGDNSYPVAAIKKMKKKSTKAVFLAGAGVRYEFNPSMFAKLEYNFEFGAKPKLHADAMPELQKIKVTSHTIKLGLGYRF